MWAAMEHKAAALLVMNPPVGDFPSVSLDWAQNKSFHHPDRALTYEADKPLTPYRMMKLNQGTLRQFLPTFSISSSLVDEIFSGTTVNLKETQQKISETGIPVSKELHNKTIILNTAVETQVIETQNVLGCIEGSDPVLRDELIVVGGHYDHLGKYNGLIWNGANDNASGTVGVTEIARAFSQDQEKPKRSILFAAWTGEEKGLLGATYFINHPFKPIEKIVLNVNFDMIGVTIGTRKNIANCFIPVQVPELKEIVTKYNEALDFNMRAMAKNMDMDFMNSDHYVFYMKKIPVLYYKAGKVVQAHHQPSDTIGTLDFNLMEKIVRSAFLHIREIANRDERLMWDDSIVR